MCGIHGLINFDGTLVEPRWLTAMGDVTAHRGPDDEGQHIDRDCGIAMRRLSIIDLAGGHQPLSNADGSLCRRPATTSRHSPTAKCCCTATPPGATTSCSA
jgi:asparagine synthetase B (glutamine-hydrolysing)